MEKKGKNKILIAGATGLIGQELTTVLVGLGYRVAVLTRNTAKAKKLFPPNVQFLKWDGIFTNWLVREVEKSYAVINLAGESIGAKRWSKKRREALVNSRVLTTNSLAKACQYAATKPAVFIQASAVGFYPNSKNEVFTEESSPGTGFLADLTKEWESIAQRDVPTEIRLIILRSGIVLSRKGGILPSLILPVKLYLGSWFGNGNQRIPWIHVHDEVNAILHLMEHNEEKGIYNLVAPESVTLKQLVVQVGKNLHRFAWLQIPSFFVRWLFGEMGQELLLGSKIVEPKRLVNSGFAFSFPTLKFAVNDLVPLEKY